MKKFFLVFSLTIVVFSLILVTGIKGTTTISENDWQDQLEQMRKEINERGYSFTVDYNSACQYPLSQLCCFKTELAMGETSTRVEADDQNFTVRLDLPSRYIGYYTPAKDQGACGSCWAFCMASAVEGLIKKMMSTEEDLSEQWLLDCNPWGWSCQGGFINFYMFMNEGALTETCYPYVGYKKPCNHSCSHLYFIYDWDWVGNSGSVPPVNDIKQAIMDYGSVAVGIVADYWFQAYSGGVFDHCTGSELNHCVALCGWDDSLGPAGAWLLKNSWDTDWGGVDINGDGRIDQETEGGFMWIIYGCNYVGYAAAYPIPYYGG